MKIETLKTRPSSRFFGQEVNSFGVLSPIRNGRVLSYCGYTEILCIFCFLGLHLFYWPFFGFTFESAKLKKINSIRATGISRRSSTDITTVAGTHPLTTTHPRSYILTMWS